MKALSIILTVLLIIALAFTGYLYVTCRVEVVSVSVSSAEASAQEDLFSHIQDEFRLNAVAGVPFTEQIGSSSADYKFCTYQVYLRNTCFLPASTLEISISPMQGDILQLPEKSQKLLPSRSEGVLECTLLTGMDQHTVRELIITYYMWGIPFSIRTVANQAS